MKNLKASFWYKLFAKPPCNWHLLFDTAGEWFYYSFSLPLARGKKKKTLCLFAHLPYTWLCYNPETKTRQVIFGSYTVLQTHWEKLIIQEGNSSKWDQEKYGVGCDTGSQESKKNASTEQLYLKTKKKKKEADGNVVDCTVLRFGRPQQCCTNFFLPKLVFLLPC